MNTTQYCTCGCTQTTTIVVPFLSGFDAESVSVDYADVEVCANCGSVPLPQYDSSDDSDELPF